MRARDNLFSADRVLQVRYRLEGITWEELLRRLERLGYRAAIAGEEGTGKTTLLEELGARLEARQGRARLVRVEGGRLPRRALSGRVRYSWWTAPSGCRGTPGWACGYAPGAPPASLSPSAGRAACRH
jgi:hypothetical protein